VPWQLLKRKMKRLELSRIAAFPRNYHSIRMAKIDFKMYYDVVVFSVEYIKFWAGRKRNHTTDKLVTSRHIYGGDMRY